MLMTLTDNGKSFCEIDDVPHPFIKVRRPVVSSGRQEAASPAHFPSLVDDFTATLDLLYDKMRLSNDQYLC